MGQVFAGHARNADPQAACPGRKSRKSTAHYAAIQVDPRWAVTTLKGPVLGGEIDACGAFLGIPFARPAVGLLRWSAPGDVFPWDLPMECTRFGPTCPQGHVPGTGNKAVPVPKNVEALLKPSPATSTELPPGLDEDCLQLNVYTPGLEGRRPVVLWFYGGNLTGGSACSDNVFDPSAKQGANPAYWARSRDLVVVTTTYRLNVFGFLNLPGGDRNCGLLDAVAALRWVQGEVGHFGGDAGNVTVCGLSAGGHVCSQLLTMPLARGLFHKAICMSGSAQWTMGSIEDHRRRVADPFAKKLGFDGCAEVAVDDARNISPEVLRQAYLGSRDFLESGTLCIDGETVPEDPIESMRNGCASQVRVLSGVTRDEGVFSTRLPKKGNSKDSVVADVARHLRQACYLTAGDLDALRNVDEKMCRETAAELVNDYLELVRRYTEASDDAKAGAVNLGVNKVPAKADSWYELAVKILGDHDFLVPHLMACWALSKHAPVHGYVFSNEADPGTRFAGHGADHNFLFATQDACPEKPTEGASALSCQIMDSWTAFARTGDPSTDALGHWPPMSFPTSAVDDAEERAKMPQNPGGTEHMNFEYMKTGVVAHGLDETQIWFRHVSRLLARAAATDPELAMRPAACAMAADLYDQGASPCAYASEDEPSTDVPGQAGEQ